MVNKAKTQEVRKIIVLLTRQVSVNPKDHRSLNLCNQIVEVLNSHINRSEEWLFSSAASDNLASLVFIKFLRLIEEHF